MSKIYYTTVGNIFNVKEYIKDYDVISSVEEPNIPQEDLLIQYLIKENILNKKFIVSNHITADKFKKVGTVDVWENYWLYNMIRWGFITHSYIDLMKSTRKFNFIFTNFNNKPKMHRCIAMDIISEKNLIENCNYTWNYIDVDYVWQHWNPILNTEKHSGVYHGFTDSNVTSFPIYRYQSSFLSLITETSMENDYTSEKTFIPILCKTPFLILGGDGINHKLKSMGFKIFEDYFDYSFDFETDLYRKINLLVSEIEKLKTQNLEKLYSDMIPILNHNYKTALRIILEEKNVPNIVKDIPKYRKVINIAKENIEALLQTEQIPALH